MKKFVWRLLMRLGIYPHIHFTYSPFKILEFSELTDDIPWTGDERVLDIGCGQGNHTLLLGRRCGHVTGIDTNPAFIEEARWFASHLPEIEVDFDDRPLEKIGFPDDTFDYVFSICVLEHIPDHESILSESLRILKPGGRMIFSVDSLEAIDDPGLIEAHRAAHQVQKYYRADELEQLLERTGFADVRVYPIFRSALARDLFIRGIRRGFNFGRLRTLSLTRRFLQAEDRTVEPTAGLFLIAKAEKPAAGTGTV